MRLFTGSLPRWVQREVDFLTGSIGSPFDSLTPFKSTQKRLARDFPAGVSILVFPGFPTFISLTIQFDESG
jgi:hypothetical protein